MKWGKKHQKKTKEEAKEASSASSSSPSSFSFSRVLSLSWFSKLGQTTTTKPNFEPTMPNKTTKVKPNSVSSPPALRSGSDVLDRLTMRLPPEPLADAPRRLSIGDDETYRARARVSHRPAISRSARHNSAGELELRPIYSFRSDLPQHVLSRACPVVIDTPSKTEQFELLPTPVRRRPARRRRRQQQRRRVAVGELSEDTETSPPRLSTARKSFRVATKPRYKVCSPRGIRRREGAHGLERFAVVKSTRDPQHDFRKSMVEMIRKKGIGQPEELENLLACYLSLNSDEHHDVIIKVFRQLWFDLDRQRFNPKCACCRRLN